MRAETASAQLRAALEIRDLIVDGELRPGDHVSEPWLAGRLKLSRTPIRLALARLHEEGFLEASPSQGLVVRSFSERDVYDAVDLRGMLEGMAARLAVERGIKPALLGRMRKCLEKLDGAVAALESVPDVTRYVQLNDEFHVMIRDASDSVMVQEALARLIRIPFAAPNAFTMAGAEPAQLVPLLVLAQAQHHDIVEAMAHREGTRAEALVREHARCATKYLRPLLAQGATRNGASLSWLKALMVQAASKGHLEAGDEDIAAPLDLASDD